MVNARKHASWSWLRRLLVTLALFALLGGTGILGGVGTATAHAQSAQPQGVVPPPPGAVCQASVSSSQATYCVAPSVVIKCGGAIGRATDGFGNPINWTFASGEAGPCVFVTYTMNYVNNLNHCDFSFYVPDGDATIDSLEIFSRIGSQVNTPADIVDEYQSEGFVPLPNISDVSTAGDPISTVHFTDDQGETTAQIGWGSGSAHSLMAICS